MPRARRAARGRRPGARGRRRRGPPAARGGRAGPGPPRSSPARGRVPGRAPPPTRGRPAASTALHRRGRQVPVLVGDAARTSPRAAGPATTRLHARGRRHDGEARAGAQRRAGREAAAAPVSPGRAGHHQHRARGVLVRAGALAGNGARAPRARPATPPARARTAEGRRCRPPRPAPRSSAPGVDPQPDHVAVEGDREVGAHRAAPATRPVSASTPEGTSSATTGPGWAVDPLHRRARRLAQGRRDAPVPSSASTTTAGARVGRGRVERPHGDADARGDRGHRRRVGRPRGAPPGATTRTATTRPRRGAGRRPCRPRRCCRVPTTTTASRTAGNASRARLRGGEAGPLHQQDRGDARGPPSPGGRPRASRRASKRGVQPGSGGRDRGLGRWPRRASFHGRRPGARPSGLRDRERDGRVAPVGQRDVDPLATPSCSARSA